MQLDDKPIKFKLSDPWGAVKFASFLIRIGIYGSKTIRSLATDNFKDFLKRRRKFVETRKEEDIVTPHEWVRKDPHAGDLTTVDG